MKSTRHTPAHQGLSNGSKSATRDAMAFQWYQEWSKRHYGLGDLKVRNKTNKLPSFVDRLG
jgi:hypothetical protein